MGPKRGKGGKGSAGQGRAKEEQKQEEEEEVHLEGGTGTKLRPSEQTEEYKTLCNRRSKLQVLIKNPRTDSVRRPASWI